MSNESGASLSLRAAIAASLRDYGPELLKRPNRMVSLLLDLTDAEERDVKIITQQFDPELAEPVIQAIEHPQNVSLETVRDRIWQMLTHQRSITSDAAVEAAEALVGGVADYLERPLTPLHKPTPRTVPVSPHTSDEPQNRSIEGDTPRQPHPQSVSASKYAESSNYSFGTRSQASSQYAQPPVTAPAPPVTASPYAPPRQGAPAWLIGLAVFLACAVIVFAGVLYVRGAFDGVNTNEQHESDTVTLASEITDSDVASETETSDGPTSDPPVFSSATSSTELEPDGYSDSYGPENVLSDDITHAWNAEYSSGDWIQLDADAPQTIHGLRILNGYAKREDVYYKNCRPRDITIELSDGYTQTATLEDLYGKKQDIKFDKAHSTDYVKLTIETSYPGNKYDDCCISRIEAY